MVAFKRRSRGGVPLPSFVELSLPISHLSTDLDYLLRSEFVSYHADVLLNQRIIEIDFCLIEIDIATL